MANLAKIETLLQAHLRALQTREMRERQDRLLKFLSHPAPLFEPWDEPTRPPRRKRRPRAMGIPAAIKLAAKAGQSLTVTQADGTTLTFDAAGQSTKADPKTAEWLRAMDGGRK